MKIKLPDQAWAKGQSSVLFRSAAEQQDASPNRTRATTSTPSPQTFPSWRARVKTSPDGGDGQRATHCHRQSTVPDTALAHPETAGWDTRARAATPAPAT